MAGDSLDPKRRCLRPVRTLEEVDEDIQLLEEDFEEEWKRVGSIYSEHNLTTFTWRAVEGPVDEMIDELYDDFELQSKFNLKGEIRRDNHSESLVPDSPSPDPRTQRPGAYQFCAYNTPRETEDAHHRVPAFFLEYRASQELPLACIYAGLEGINDTDLDEVVSDQNPKTPQDKCRQLIAAMFTDAFSYMTFAGLGVIPAARFYPSSISDKAAQPTMAQFCDSSAKDLGR
ncbi:hypothetical protein EJ06DRAFT_549505 [Trichodelitschia bisporula]|uniref:Uncharacterized protein n=1 Tax=Trichodelitschia bisporula TaxID=703511 RepID=A0A6G1HU23_9PEZI|nr:hypothetical protein EJ06DRAFT_549505 [Trichodelitschia bisporula]